MADRPYTDDDLRKEAARQLFAHRWSARDQQVYAAMLDARIDSTDGTTWSEALDVLDLPVPAIHALIEGAADVTKWAVDLGADGLEPEDHTIALSAGDRPLVRLHLAFDPGLPDEVRQAVVMQLGQAMADAL